MQIPDLTAFNPFNSDNPDLLNSLRPETVRALENIPGGVDWYRESGKPVIQVLPGGVIEVFTECPFCGRWLDGEKMFHKTCADYEKGHADHVAEARSSELAAAPMAGGHS